MNIGFLSVHPQSESLGTNSRLKNLCLTLSDLGHNALLFTPYVFSGNWGERTQFHQIKALIQSSGISAKIYSIARKVLNTKVLSRHLILRKKTINAMITRFSTGILSYLEIHPEIKLDYILGESEIASLALCRIKDKLCIPIIAELNNFWPEELVVSGMIKKTSKQYAYLIELEREILAKADRINTVADYFKEYLIKEFGVEENKIFPLYHGGSPLRDKPEPREKPPRIIYAGNVAPRSNLELMIRAIPFVLKEVPDAEFYITRKGEDLAKIQKLARKLGVSPFFYWYEKFGDFVTFLSKCSVGILTSSQDLPAKFGPASKMFDYFNCGVPIVGNYIGSWTTELQEKQVALMTSDDPQEFAAAIVKFLKNPTLAEEYSLRGIQLVKGKYLWTNLVKNYFLPSLNQLKNQ